ncbi:MAG: hypothetical protein U0M51_04360 [Eggerthellaceae bacterium]
MRESAFQRKCIERARKAGLLAVNNHGSGWSNKGYPDLTLFGRGKCVQVELKSDSGYKVQEDQIVWRNRFERHGIPHRVIEGGDLDAFDAMIREEFGS